MAKTLKGGHRVRFEDDERLDIPDTEALPELVYDYLNEISSLLAGGSATNLSGSLPVGGTITELRFDTSNPAATTIYGPGGSVTDKAVFSLSYQVQLGEFEHHVLTYDPSATGQQTTIDLFNGLNDGDQPYIWARRIDVNTDVDTRRKWDVVGGQETLFSLATRESYRIEFEKTLGVTPPSADPRWCPIAQVVLISGGKTVYQFALIHPFDAGTIGTASSRYWGTLLPSSSGTSYRYLGVAQALYQLKALHNAQETQIATLTTDLATEVTDRTNADAAIQTQVDDLSSKIGFSRSAFIRLIHFGAGTWQIAETSDVANTVVSLASGWELEVEFPGVVDSPASVQITVGNNNTGSFPGQVDLVAQAQQVPKPLFSHQIVFIRLNTNSFLESNSWAWTASYPPGNPPINATLDILVVQ